MSTTLYGVAADAMKLSRTERAELTARIADTLLPAPPLHPAWDAELARRLADMDAGVAPSMPAEQAVDKLHGVAASAVSVKVEFRPEARRELVEAAQWYAAEGGAIVVGQFGGALERALQLIGAPPSSMPCSAIICAPCRSNASPTRWHLACRGTVMSVANQSRASGCWAGRG